MPLREVTTAEVLKAAEYATAHFGKWHLGGIPNAAGGTGRGLPESFCPKPRHPGNQGFDEWWSAGNHYEIGHEFIYHNGEQVPPKPGDTSDVLMTVALEWIGKQATAKKPFLALIWFPSPHGPHKATPEDAAAYAQSGKGKADYYGEIAGVDRAMGQLRKSLRDLKIADDTMVWFCSDNGSAPPGTTGGLPGRKKHLTEGGLRVPGVLEWPARIKKPFATSVPVCTTDFHPTVIDLLGLKLPDECGPVDGISLLPLIDGKMEQRPKPIPFVDGNQTRLIDNEYSMVNGKLYRFADGGRQDIDITAKEPEVLKKMNGWMADWRASVKQDLSAYNFKKPAKPKPQGAGLPD